MGSSVNDLGAANANGQRLRDGDASPGEKRTASGTSAGEWLVNVADDVVVPMTTAEVVEGVRAGKLSERSLVWRIGMHDWATLLDVPQLRMAATASSAAPASARVAVQPPAAPQADGQRRRNTLPFGFPALRDSASVRQPVGLGLPAPSPVATPISAPRLNPPPKPTGARPSHAPPKPAPQEESDALAVYERPMASLTFSDSALAEWQGTGRLVRQATEPPPNQPMFATEATLRLTPVPPRSAPLPRRTRSSRAPSTLAPTTAEAENRDAVRAPAPWGDLSVVLASEYRAVQKTSKRVALWAALGSAVLASVFTLWLVRSPASAPKAAAALPEVAAATAPVLAPTLEVRPPSVEPSASAAPALKPPPAVARAAPKPAPARPARPKAVALVVPPAAADGSGTGDPPSEPNTAGTVTSAPASTVNETPSAAATPSIDAPTPAPTATATVNVAAAPTTTSGL